VEAIVFVGITVATVVPTIAITVGAIFLVVRIVKNGQDVKIEDGVPGSFQVVRVSASDEAMNGTIVGVLSAPGIAARTAQRHVIFPSGWGGRNRPSVGTVLPVVVDPADPRRFNILWRHVPDAVQEAAQIAARMNSQGAARPVADLGNGEFTWQTAAHDDAIVVAQSHLFAGARAEPGQARVLSAVRTDAHRHLITVEVRRGMNDAPYHIQARVTCDTPRYEQLFTTPGNVLPVLVSPAHPLAVIPDTSRLPR